MRVVITKHDIVKALQTEPLTYRAWIERAEDQYDQIYELSRFDPSCASCAVGSVLKRKAGNVETIGQFTNLCRRAVDNQALPDEAPVDEGNWLGALSVVWEYLNTHNGMATTEELRPNIIAWAEDNIPEGYTKTLVM